MCNLDGRGDVAKASEYLVHRDDLARLMAGVHRLKKLTDNISDAELDRWYRIVARFERSCLDARQRLARPDLLVYLAALLLSAAENEGSASAKVAADRLPIGRRSAAGSARFRKSNLDQVKQ